MTYVRTQFCNRFDTFIRKPVNFAGNRRVVTCVIRDKTPSPDHPIVVWYGN
jgi:hypothetical protein